MLIFLCFIRISNHQEAAEARRREGIQRREAIVKNKILREFALDQSKSKKEALLELRSEMGEALHQTKERLNVLYFQPISFSLTDSVICLYRTGGGDPTSGLQ